MKGVVLAGGTGSRLLANGKEFGPKHIHYTYQEGEGGIADRRRPKSR